MPGGCAKPAMMPRLFARLRALRRDRSGATIIEFAAVAAPFIALMLATIQTSLVFFAQHAAGAVDQPPGDEEQEGGRSRDPPVDPGGKEQPTGAKRNGEAAKARQDHRAPPARFGTLRPVRRRDHPQQRGDREARRHRAVRDAQRPAERGQHRLQRRIACRDRQHHHEQQRKLAVDRGGRLHAFTHR